MPLIRRAIPLLLAAALAVSARAGVVAPAGPGVVYAPPALVWSGPLGTAFTDPLITPLLPSGLSGPSLSTPAGLRAAAPLVASLTHALEIKPAAFAAMDAAQKKTAIELAVEDAKQSVQAKAYELAEEAHALTRPGRPMDKETRAELYATVSKLMEMREFYGPWLDEHAAGNIAESYELVSAKAWEVRTTLLQQDAEPAAPRETKASRPAPARPFYVLRPSANAVSLRESMQLNKSGWGQGDLDDLYTGYGFELRQGGKHRFYSHPAFPQLHETVSRQNDLPPGYAQSALKLIAELERLTAAQHVSAAAPATGPPATLTLADLSILLSQPKPPKIEIIETSRRVHEPKRVAVKVAVAAGRAVNTEPTAPAPPPVTAQLSPATPHELESTPEPPPAKSNPDKKNGVIERIKAAWDRRKNSPN